MPEATRIIPARAGFTGTTASPQDCCPDHPRSRGVYGEKMVGWICKAGSSPLARGLRSERVNDLGLLGIIPARAGFTGSALCAFDLAADHPRSRGVYCERGEGAEVGSGSSPLARGLRDWRLLSSTFWRIIPARAGFTTGLMHELDFPPDHPRSRGVYVWTVSDTKAVTGSSPLARGLLHALGGATVLNRIIPARAGFTSLLMRGIMSWPDHPRSRGVYAGDPGGS